jgi:hypothetical protein
VINEETKLNDADQQAVDYSTEPKAYRLPTSTPSSGGSYALRITTGCRVLSSSSSGTTPNATPITRTQCGAIPPPTSVSTCSRGTARCTTVDDLAPSPANRPAVPASLFPGDTETLSGEVLQATVLDRTVGWAPGLREFIGGSDPATVNAVPSAAQLRLPPGRLDR